MKHSKTIYTLCLILCTMVFSLTTKAQGFINWSSSGGTPNAWSGTYTGGTVSVTQGATGASITNYTPVNYTNLNSTSGAQGFATLGPYATPPSRSLTFTFSTPVIINELTIADIDLGGNWNDAFTFSGVTFSSVVGANCNRTTTSATPTGDSGASAEWALWSTSTTPVSSFTINYATTGGLTHAVLNYSMKVTKVTCSAGTTAPTLSASTKANVCPATTVDLTTITASNLPGGTTLTWHTATPATTANKVTGNSVAAGTYYAAFFDATANCYSGTGGNGSATTTVTATVAACCVAGTSAPTLSASTKANVCPATTVDLTTITASNLPGSTTLTWHTGTPATTANKVTGTSVAAGTYYAAFFDATANCYSGTGGNGSATTTVTATVSSCITPVTVGTPAVISGVTGTTITGNPPTSVSGGTAPYTYSNGAGDPLCTTPTSPTLTLPSGKITGLNSSTGAHSVNLTGVSPGTYQYCIKVCDSTGTNCDMSIHIVTVTGASCNAGSVAPSLIKN